MYFYLLLYKTHVVGTHSEFPHVFFFFFFFFFLYIYLENLIEAIQSNEYQ